MSLTVPYMLTLTLSIPLQMANAAILPRLNGFENIAVNPNFTPEESAYLEAGKAEVTKALGWANQGIALPSAAVSPDPAPETTSSTLQSTTTLSASAVANTTIADSAPEAPATATPATETPATETPAPTLGSPNQVRDEHLVNEFDIPPGDYDNVIKARDRTKINEYASEASVSNLSGLKTLVLPTSILAAISGGASTAPAI